jgi:hypothetical protein
MNSKETGCENMDQRSDNRSIEKGFCPMEKAGKLCTITLHTALPYDVLLCFNYAMCKWLPWALRSDDVAFSRIQFTWFFLLFSLIIISLPLSLSPSLWGLYRVPDRARTMFWSWKNYFPRALQLKNLLDVKEQLQLTTEEKKVKNRIERKLYNI